jgi:hypothetical protein
MHDAASTMRDADFEAGRPRVPKSSARRTALWKASTSNQSVRRRCHTAETTREQSLVIVAAGLGKLVNFRSPHNGQFQLPSTPDDRNGAVLCDADLLPTLFVDDGPTLDNGHRAANRLRLFLRKNRRGS